MDPSNAKRVVGEGTPNMLYVPFLSVFPNSATVKISSDNPGAAIPPTTLLVDAIGLKVNELDGAPEGLVG